MDGENGIRISGDQDNVKAAETGKTAEGKTGTGGGAGGGRNRNSSPAAASGKSAAGSAAGSTEKNNVPEANGNPVSIPVPTLNIPAPAVPKKKAASKADALDKSLEGNVRMLIGAGFGFASKITKSDVWTVSDEEAASISTPLTKILQRLGVNDSLNKYADYIGLCTALTVVIVPRVIITQQQQPKNKPQGVSLLHGGKKTADQVTTPKPDGDVNSTAADNAPASIKAVLDFGN